MNHSISPIAAFRSLLVHRGLLQQFTRRQVASRYRGSMLGVLWSLITPLLMLLVYSFVFVVVFNARWGGASDAPKGEFAILLFSGLVLHGFLAECLTRAPVAITENRNFVKKVIFPLELLPVSVVASALVQLGVSLAVLLAGMLVVYGYLPLTALWLPVVLLPFVLLVQGLSWGLASLGVYVRDIRQVMGVLTAVLLFLSTIFYPAEKLPAPMDSLIYLNPLSFVVDQLRLVLVAGTPPVLRGFALYTLVAAVVFAAGFAWFQRTRRGFADVV